MANIDNTVLTSDNPAKFDEITRDIKFDKAWIVSREPGKLFLEQRWGVPHEDLIRLSRAHPEVTFRAQYSFEHDWYSTLHHAEYKNGEQVAYHIEHGYSIDDKPEGVPEKSHKELWDKATEIFKRVDVIRENEKGDKYIDWFDGMMTIEVTNGEYKMQASKHTHFIDEVVYLKAREVKEIVWEKVQELPF
jgi:hypothetical protein